jgi:hypothetical protein
MHERIPGWEVALATAVECGAAADRCPFHRSLGDDFRGCPAFVASAYRAIDLQRRPALPVVTCAHLTVGAQPRGASFYPRCGLGTAADRERWVEEITPELLERLRALSAAYRGWVGSRMPPLWELKAAFLRAQQAGDEQAAWQARQALRGAVDGLLKDVDEFLAVHESQLQAVRLTGAMLRPVLRAATGHFAFSDRSAERYRVPDDVLEGFPLRVRLFLTAGRPAPE